MNNMINTDQLGQAIGRGKEYIDTTIENKITGSGEYMVSGLVENVPGVELAEGKPDYIERSVNFGRTFTTPPVVIPSVIGDSAVYATLGSQSSPVSIMSVTRTGFTFQSACIGTVNVCWIALGK